MNASSRTSTPRRAVSFCFDDGFRRSSEEVATLFSAHGVRACFCVLAAPHETADSYVRKFETGGWANWRALRAAGHEIAPHGWAHENLFDLSFAAATDSILRTWDAFASELPGFDPQESVFHPAYLRAPDELVAWLGTHALAARIAGADGINAWQASKRGGIVNCVCFGPRDVDVRMRDRVSSFLAGEGDWLVPVLHGIDDEGWGPISRTALQDLVETILDAGVRIETPNRLLLEKI